MKKLILLLPFFIFNASYSQIPHIKGTVELDIEKGYFHCDFTLSNLPKLTEYKILLNHGMNIKFFKTNNTLISYNGYINGEMKQEALEYFFIDTNGNQIELPSEFTIDYSGAFPVYSNTKNLFDFKGYIAINDKTLRATEQSKWYPIIYDEKNDRLIESYTYEISIKNKKCESVFINGNKPKKGKKVNLSSKKPVPLFLFVGKYDFIKKNENYLINVDLSQKSITDIFNNIQIIKDFYSTLLKVDFNDNIYIINHNAVKKMGTDYWGFNVYPSLGFSNLDFNELLSEKGLFKENYYKLFSHEFAHNYFGNSVNSGKLSWFWLESTAEYLSFLALENYTNSKNIDEYYEYYISNIKTKNFISLCNIISKNQIDDNYRYILGPLIFKSFEITFGKDKTIQTLRTLLKKSTKETLTIENWKTSASENGISETEFDKFKNSFLCGEKFKKNIINLIENTNANKVYKSLGSK